MSYAENRGWAFPCAAIVDQETVLPNMTSCISADCSWQRTWRGSIPMPLLHLPFKFKCQLEQTNTTDFTIFSPLVWSLLVDLISGRRMGTPIGFGRMSLLCCRTSSLSCGLAGQRARSGSPFSVGPALCVSCYPFPWIWFVTSICTITRNLIRLCACQMIQMSGTDEAKQF